MLTCVPTGDFPIEGLEKNEPLLNTATGRMNMATDAVERRIAHVRGVTVTTIACLAGLGAGVVSTYVAEGASDPFAVFVLAGAVLIQFPLYRLIEAAGVKLDVEDFSTKDYLYIAFMTFALWFVSWTILLTTGY